MITTLDPEYQETRRIKRGECRMTAPFDVLAAWIGRKWQVNVLNVVYLPKEKKIHPPRLVVVVEHDTDEAKLARGRVGGEDGDAIAGEFRRLAAATGRRFVYKDLIVKCSAFAPMACFEASDQITHQEVERFAAGLGNPDLWSILRFFTRIVFMFHTREQARAYGQSGIMEQYWRAYFERMRPYDEFGYLDERYFTVEIDSKQRFDEDFRSNSYYYFRG